MSHRREESVTRRFVTGLIPMLAAGNDGITDNNEQNDNVWYATVCFFVNIVLVPEKSTTVY